MVTEMKKEVLATSFIMLLLLSTFASIPSNFLPVVHSNGAGFTGRIFDYGNDTDGDGLFNFLVIDVELTVFEDGVYRVQIDTIRDQYDNPLFIQIYNETYLDTGTRNVTLMLNGMILYSAKFDVAKVASISIIREYYILVYLDGYALSTVYDFTLFDTGATLTGIIYDEGIDTDSNGLFNYLQIGVQVNVTDAALYQISVSGLYNNSDYWHNYISVYNYTEKFLDVGMHVLNVALPGSPIYASRANNISKVSMISLVFREDYQIYQLDSRSNVLLSRPYSYDEFEALAYFTGTFFDEGVDSDGDSKYDYLQISAEINVTKEGYYMVELESLADNTLLYLYVHQSISGYFDVGTHMVNVTVYGPLLYGSRFSPRYIGTMRIVAWDPWQVLDTISNMPLSMLYNYSDFESHAFLTGNVTDEGVDTDGSGLYDYLRIGIEVNVTEAGRYRLSAYQLVDDSGPYTQYLYAYKSTEMDLDAGVHTVYFNFEGSMLAYNRFSPTGIFSIELQETLYPYVRLSQISPATLSRRYDYTLFDAPLKDMQFNLIVYPNGTIGVEGIANFTHMYPQNPGPLMNATMNISTAGETTTGSASGVIMLPESGMYPWPYHYIVANLDAHYGDGLSNATLGIDLFMPPEASTIYPLNASDFTLNALYADGLLDVTLQGETELPPIPFNLTDFIAYLDFMGEEISGNITFRTAAGFPLGDIVVYLDGNKTAMHLTGHVNVTYGNFFDMMELNSTSLQYLLDELNSTLSGPSGIVYNMTFGMLECTNFNYTKTPWYQESEEAGADVQYNVTISGNFTGFFARLLAQMMNPYDPDSIYPTVHAALDSALPSVQNASLEMVYWQAFNTLSLDLHFAYDVYALWEKALELLPPTVPTEYRTQAEAILKIYNATSYAIKDFSFNASYSNSLQKLRLDAWILVNSTQLKDNMLPLLLDTVPPQLKPIFEAYLNTTYCTVTSSNMKCDYVNGTANFEYDWVLEGDFRAEVNHVKRFYIDYLNATIPSMLTWQYRMINMTEINLNNFLVEFRLGTDSMHFAFNGLIVQPPKDEIDAARFKLYTLFNMPSGDPYEPPRASEKLQVTITGGFNGTHAVLLYAPGRVPPPDVKSLDYTSMTWENVSISRLKDLVFGIAYLKSIDYLGETYYSYILTNSTVSDFNFNSGAKSISFNVTGTSGTGFCNITIPRALLYANLTEWVVQFDGRMLDPDEYSVTENAEYAFIHLNYSHSSHLIQITGTWIITEFQPNMLLLSLIILSLIVAAITIKKRKKISMIKTNYQNTIRAFVNRLHQPKT